MLGAVNLEFLILILTGAEIWQYFNMATCLCVKERASTMGRGEELLTATGKSQRLGHMQRKGAAGGDIDAWS